MSPSSQIPMLCSDTYSDGTSWVDSTGIQFDQFNVAVYRMLHALMLALDGTGIDIW